jgi:hypothetical protein
MQARSSWSNLAQTVTAVHDGHTAGRQIPLFFKDICLNGGRSIVPSISIMGTSVGKPGTM